MTDDAFAANQDPTTQNTIEVACSHCSKVYNFDASQIPPAGYTAECVACKGQFFVGPPPGDNPFEALPSEEEVMSANAQMGLATEAINTAELQLELEAATPTPAGAPPPAPPPVDVSSDDDWDQTEERNKQRGKVMVLAAVGAVAAMILGVIGLYFVAPRAFDSSVGATLGIKAAVPAEAIQKLDEAIALLNNDTLEDYDKAIEVIEASLQIDPYFDRALAYAGLVRSMRASLDMLAQEQHIDQSKYLSAKIKSLQDMPPRQKPKNHAEMVETFSLLIKDNNRKAEEKFNRAQERFQEAKPFIDNALGRYKSTPEVYAATGLYTILSNRKSGGSGAKAALERYCQLVGASACETDKIETVMGAYLSALVRESYSRKSYDALAEWESVTNKHPGFMRGRLELVRLLDGNKHKEGVQERLKALLAELKSQNTTNASVQMLAKKWLDDADADKAEPSQTSVARKGKKRRKKKKR